MISNLLCAQWEHTRGRTPIIVKENRPVSQFKQKMTFRILKCYVTKREIKGKSLLEVSWWKFTLNLSTTTTAKGHTWNGSQVDHIIEHCQEIRYKCSKK